MRIRKINRSASGLTDSRKSAVQTEVVSDVAGRALVVTEHEHVKHGAGSANFRQTPFLAQLIATKDHHPQTRDRRRAEPADVIDAYRAVEAMTDFDKH